MDLIPAEYSIALTEDPAGRDVDGCPRTYRSIQKISARARRHQTRREEAWATSVLSEPRAPVPSITINKVISQRIPYLRNSFHAMMMSVRPCLRISKLCMRCCYSTPAPPPAPPLLLKMRGDMKEAMKAKDSNRLNVLRALLAEYTNAAKTSSPIKTNIQLLSLLRKRIAASRSAAVEFSAANRSDLKDKEEAQITVLEEYAGGVETLGQEEITRVVGESIGKMRTEGHKVDTGTVLKHLLGPGGVLDGKPVEKGEVARVVKGML